MEIPPRKHLPSMSMLLGFIAAARHGSVSKAADETGMTQGAVSRQIASLESWLGSPLFDRSGRNVVLNATGRAFLDAIDPAMWAIARASRKLMNAPEGRVVELATLPSFGMRWLAPRLSEMSSKHPDLIVNISAQSEEFDFAHERFDLAIHVGNADWPGVEHELLFSEHVVPVASAELARASQIESAKGFLKLPLLVQSHRRDAWERWFAVAGVALDEIPVTSSAAHFLMLAQAVLAGAGAALLPTFLIEPELAAGTLVIPVDLPLIEDRNYYLVYPKQNLERLAVREVRDFICAAAQEPARGFRARAASSGPGSNP